MYDYVLSFVEGEEVTTKEIALWTVWKTKFELYKNLKSTYLFFTWLLVHDSNYLINISL